MAIVHGWAEGPWQSQDFVSCLENAGFSLADNPAAADVVVAHSAGCFLVPENINAQLIMLIGLPFWPGKPLPASLMQKLVLEAKQHQKRHNLGWFANKLAHNTWYILARPKSFWSFFKNRHSLKLPKASAGLKVVLVRNKDDRFCTPKVMELLPMAEDYNFVEMPGIHDDCWIDPAGYVDLIRQHL